MNTTYHYYSQTTARFHLDKVVSDEFPVNRGVRQGDPLSPKLFAAVMEEVFKKTDISEGISVDGENHTSLKFADDVVLFNEKQNKLKQHLNSLNSKSLKVGLKYTRERQRT